MTVEETAELCFKTVRTVKQWDKGKEIPKECKRLMRKHKRLELSHKDEWYGFKMNSGLLELPTGHRVTPQEILTGIALLNINSELEVTISSKLLKYAVAIARIKTLR
ncbi:MULTISPECIES: regulator [unclassified Vibrio]|uniref:regulator n=1 Tax=unclassified Vibrio TaxID=2614977 RepID=UPI001F366681|nr:MULTISPECIES: regulator [unclassified Vibrio]QXL80156.1 hypothetical protein [Vibrio sp.]